MSSGKFPRDIMTNWKYFEGIIQQVIYWIKYEQTGEHKKKKKAERIYF